MTKIPSLHENPENLSTSVVDRHWAIASLMEELEAVDWYDQRVEATIDEELRSILAHNRDEEKEHAAMVIEWLRRNDETFERHLKTYLFSDRSIVALELEDTESGVTEDEADNSISLHIGSLRTESAE